MKPYRSKKHPAPRGMSRGLRSLPPPAPFGSPTGINRAARETHDWVALARSDVRRAANFFRGCTDVFRSWRRELEAMR